MSRRVALSDTSSDDSDVEEVSPPKIMKRNIPDNNCQKKGPSSQNKSSKTGVVRRKGMSRLIGDDSDDGGRGQVNSSSSAKNPDPVIKQETDERSTDGALKDASNDVAPEDNGGAAPDEKPEVAPRLTDAQRAKIERNRQKALLLKQARLAKMPTVPIGGADNEGGFSGAKKNEKMTRVIDSGGGFLIEEEVGGENEEEQPKETVSKAPGAILQDHLPDSDPSKLVCEGCEKPFSDSYLFSHFDCNVCDDCRDHEEKHRLITKTDAKNEYLLKDEDFFIREPPLKYILKKNPHNSRWGDMKLFLHCQVHARAMEIYGSEEALEDKHDQRDEARNKMRQKKFDKKVKELRKKVRSSLFTKQLGGHQHEFGDEEEYDSNTDEYSKKCKTCSHVITYEKM